MALENFIKTVWISGIMRALQKNLVFGSLANTEFEGNLKNLNDEVKIMMIGDVTAKDYTKDADIDDPEDIQDAASFLKADQAKYFNFKANDVEAVQEKPTLLNEATMRASYAIRDGVDQYIAGLYGQASIKNYSSGTTKWALNSLNVEDMLISVGQQMDEANIPREGRWITVPPWVHAKMVLAGLATKSLNDQLYVNGLVEQVLNFSVRLSNNVHADTPSTKAGTHMLAGVGNQCFSYAGVISSIEAYRPQKRFEDAIKGLFVFGAKNIRPDKTVCVYADYAAEA